MAVEDDADTGSPDDVRVASEIGHFPGLVSRGEAEEDALTGEPEAGAVVSSSGRKRDSSSSLY